MKAVKAYIEILVKPKDPEQRVMQKAIVISILFVVFLFYYKHFRSWSYSEEYLQTVWQSFLFIVFIGMLGGSIAAGFYKMFLKSVGAQNIESSWTTFWAECLFSLTAPIFSFIFIFFVILFFTPS